MTSLFRTLALLLPAIAASMPAQTPTTPGSPSTGTPAPATAIDPAQGAVWDLTVMYPDAAAADRERLAIIAALPSLAAFKGHLGDSAATLRAALDRRSELLQRTRKLRRYSSMKVYEDARIESSQALAASVADLIDKFGAASAFLDPEILATGKSKLAAFEASDPGLAPHRRDLDLLLRSADHVLQPETEAAIAASRSLRHAPSITHDVFTNAEMPWPTIMVHGKSTRLTRATYRRLLSDPDRETRRAVFEAFTAALAQFKNTQASLLQAYVAGAAYEARLRHYPSSAAFLLADDAMPADAFDALSKAADAEQPVIDRYLRLRAQSLGIAQPHSYDAAVPLAGGSGFYPLADGESIVLKALAPLGQQYVDQLSAGFQARRMHAIASPAKAPGAMTISGGRDVPPFVLLTYTGDAESISILAHEWGHAMQMDMTRRAQPPETENSSIFVGDTPSLLNEMLVTDYMAAHAVNRDERIAALAEAVETLRGTYYRVLPTMRLEMAERAAADRGEPLTADKITQLNCDQMRAFNGADRGVSIVDPGACLSWTISQEPYDDLYFYKYLIAVSAAAYFAEGIEHGDPAMRDRYFALLRAGGSDDPYPLLKRAGFDAREPSAYAAIGHRFEHDVDALERELRDAGRLNVTPPATPRQ